MCKMVFFLFYLLISLRLKHFTKTKQDACKMLQTAPQNAGQFVPFCTLVFNLPAHRCDTQRMFFRSLLLSPE
jgi:hypothetical protein